MEKNEKVQNGAKYSAKRAEYIVSVVLPFVYRQASALLDLVNTSTPFFSEETVESVGDFYDSVLKDCDRVMTELIINDKND